MRNHLFRIKQEGMEFRNDENIDVDERLIFATKKRQ